MVYCIGLTGFISSGKSTVANFFSEKNISIIDTDQIVKKLIKKKTFFWRKIIQNFGTSILEDNQEINRIQLRNIIFHNFQKRIWIENLLHPFVRKITNKRINNNKSIYCIIAIPLLNKKKLLEYPINRVLCVLSTFEKQIRRFLMNQNNNKKIFKKIINSQPSIKEKLEISNDILLNITSKNQLKSDTLILHKKYLEYAKIFKKNI